MFFKTEPNVSDGEKARLEFYIQEIADCIGFDKCRRPVQTLSALSGAALNCESPGEIIRFVGDVLAYDTTDLRFEVIPGPLEKSGGGG